MFLPPIDDPLATAPPDLKASGQREPQQIVVQQHLRSAPGIQDFESDVDIAFSRCPTNDDSIPFPDCWTRPLPECRGTSALSADLSADSEVYSESTPSTFSEYYSSDHSTISVDGRTDTMSRSPSGSLQGLGFSFSRQATFTSTITSTYPSPSILSGYVPPLWQHHPCAAAADVHSTPLPSCHYLPASSSLSVHQEEVISHVSPGGQWLYDANVDQGGTAFPLDHIGINPSLLSMPIPNVDSICLENSLSNPEQLWGQHSHVAPTDALSLGSCMQASRHYDGVPLSSPLLHYTGPKENASKAYVHDMDLSKKPATSGKKQRIQSTKKVFACTWIGCKKAFARTNNLKVHHETVHLEMRPFICPFPGCQKAEKGFSRKYDLNSHIQRQHAVESGNMPTA